MFFKLPSSSICLTPLIMCSVISMFKPKQSGGKYQFLKQFATNPKLKVRNSRLSSSNRTNH